MAIKRGVSLYSYQQAYYTKKLDLEGCIKTAVTTTGCTGIELIYEQMPLERYPDAVYPNISDKGVARWKDLMAKYGTVPTCMDSFIDSKIYKGRISYMQEQVQMMEQDLKLASKLGFSCIRVLALVPPEVLEACIPMAEYYGVAMGQEVHPRFALDDPWILNVVEIARKHHTKYLGLIPDFGIFNKGLNSAQLNYLKIMGEDSALVDEAAKLFREDKSAQEVAEFIRTRGGSERFARMAGSSSFMGRYADPQKLRDVLDVVVHFHGKCYCVDENGNDPMMNYEEPIQILKEENWDGYISTEFEGQRTYHGQDCPYEEDEIEQVRRHHVMLKRLIG